MYIYIQRYRYLLKNNNLYIYKNIDISLKTIIFMYIYIRIYIYKDIDICSKTIIFMYIYICICKIIDIC